MLGLEPEVASGGRSPRQAFNERKNFVMTARSEVVIALCVSLLSLTFRRRRAHRSGIFLIPSLAMLHRRFDQDARIVTVPEVDCA